MRPLAIGSQQASARLPAPRPRTGTPGHGSPSRGTGRASCGAFFGYQPDTAGVNSQVPKPFLRQCAACSATTPPRTNPRSLTALSTRVRVASATRSGWLRTLEILLATRLDGRGLDTAGSQLVVPSDRCGARYVSAITRVWAGPYGSLTA